MNKIFLKTAGTLFSMFVLCTYVETAEGGDHLKEKTESVVPAMVKAAPSQSAQDDADAWFQAELEKEKEHMERAVRIVDKQLRLNRDPWAEDRLLFQKK